MKKPLTHIAQCLLCQAHSKHNTTRIVAHFIDHVHIAITFIGKARSRLTISISFIFPFYFWSPP
ncbi:hypothetical protein CGH43_15140 [Vibrio parahaemolyticus]|nr:hypothetical protein [Vibrio parahaemolyticus]MCR9857277.1 hypothetical protein [Vibrio parahaemolyticus]TOM96525.1 hypothetical protein CGH66_14320 [Vibrio parahaemolyticus]TON64036.1 hypothetical protein CGH52_25025 [Vibrio parahaemolyticus]TOO12595.1 hypothetical protein CGH43_15140 [Vibrio parahaemolyticus]